MFSYSVFEQDLSNWNVVKVGTMLNVFDNCNVSAWWANPDLEYEERLDILQKLQHKNLLTENMLNVNLKNNIKI